MPKVSREGSRRFHDKFHNYVRYVNAGGHNKKYRKEYVRIVTITRTTRRRNSLALDAERDCL